MQEILYQTADAGVSLSDRGCRSSFIRQRRQESLYQTADAEVSLSDSGAGVSLLDSGCGRHSIRQLVQKSLYQTADAEISLATAGCRRLSIKQRLHLTGVCPHPLSDRGTSASLSDRVFPASAV